MLSCILLFLEPFTLPFFAIYALAGITNMVDGPVARRLDAESDFGARLDSIADLIFILVCFVKILPVISLPLWIWVGAGLVVLVKVINIVSGFVLEKRIVLPHTTANKLTGLLLFLAPFALSPIDPTLPIGIVVVIALFAAVQEGHFIRTGRASQPTP